MDNYKPTTEQFQEDLARSEDALEFLAQYGADVATTKRVPVHSMHPVYKAEGADGNPGVYFKIAKPARKGGPDTREMTTEAGIYTNILTPLDIPGVPDAKVVQVSGWPVLAVEEVPGRTYAEVFRDIAASGERVANSTEFKQVLERAAEIATRGYALHVALPGQTPTLFGKFDGGEFSFLAYRRTLGTLEKAGIDVTPYRTLLEAIEPILTDPNHRGLYIDPNAHNIIQHPEHGPVNIDVGTTKYDPAGIKIVALMETPGTGMDDVTLFEKLDAAQTWRDVKSDLGGNVKSGELTGIEFLAASALKNMSAWASRLIHVQSNEADIAKGGEEGARAQQEMPANIAAQDFHKTRLLDALRGLEAAGFQRNSLEDAYQRIKGDLY
jgi:hypothetical protein